MRSPTTSAGTSRATRSSPARTRSATAPGKFVSRHKAWDAAAAASARCARRRDGDRRFTRRGSRARERAAAERHFQRRAASSPTRSSSSSTTRSRTCRARRPRASSSCGGRSSTWRSSRRFEARTRDARSASWPTRTSASPASQGGLFESHLGDTRAARAEPGARHRDPARLLARGESDGRAGPGGARRDASCSSPRFCMVAGDAEAAPGRRPARPTAILLARWRRRLPRDSALRGARRPRASLRRAWRSRAHGEREDALAMLDASARDASERCARQIPANAATGASSASRTR